MSAWQKCEVPLDNEDTATPETVINKYTVSLATTVLVVLVLWMVRPPFVCERVRGVHAPQLRAGRVLCAAIVAGILVLLAPWIFKGASMVRSRGL